MATISAEEVKALPDLTENDALAYSHVQSLAQIQTEIQELRQSLPLLLHPLTHNTNDVPVTVTTAATTVTSSTAIPASPTATTNGAKVLEAEPTKLSSTTNQPAIPATEVSAEFSKRSMEVQSKVQLLVKNLESLCDTLEAAEKLRNEDYNERREFVPSQDSLRLQRTNVLREMPAIGLDEQVNAESMARPIQQGAYLFEGQTDGHGDMYDDFGLSNYNDTWNSFEVENVGPP